MNTKRCASPRSHRLRVCIAFFVIIAAGAAEWAHVRSFASYAQSPGYALSWGDAPNVPGYRSQADWFIDAGWKTHEELYRTSSPAAYQVGDTAEFILLDRPSRRAGTLVLQGQTTHASFWFEAGVDVDMATLDYVADTFERQIWPVTSDVFGTPEGGGRLHLIHQEVIPSQAMGAFNVEDQCPKSLCPKSNESDALYINLEAAPLGTVDYFSVLAHELQHIIRYKLDSNERLWLDEGLSQLAQHLNGYPVNLVTVRQFLRRPDHRLNSWTLVGLDMDNHYGAAYLFTLYLYERFGVELIQDMVRSDRDGLAAVQDALIASGQAVSVDDVFADWLLANYLDDPAVGTGSFSYRSLDIRNQLHAETMPTTLTGFTRADTVNQYGADYIQLERPGTYTITFDGSDVARLVSAAPYSGNWMWWSFDGEQSITRLTGAFDLTALDRATLTFAAQWNIEPEYDWFQVLVSATNGRDWQIVSGEHAENVGQYAPGAHYTNSVWSWVEEQIDLTAYAGKNVLIRFEYVTDGSDSETGVVLDDIGILELDNVDHAEQPSPTWVAEGFMRIGQFAPQYWTVAIVHEQAGEIPTVQHMMLDAANAGQVTVTVPRAGTATIVIGAMAPFAAKRAEYELSVWPTDPVNS